LATSAYPISPASIRAGSARRRTHRLARRLARCPERTQQIDAVERISPVSTESERLPVRSPALDPDVRQSVRQPFLSSWGLRRYQAAQDPLPGHRVAAANGGRR
jgi:hypothetical protein